MSPKVSRALFTVLLVPFFSSLNSPPLLKESEGLAKQNRKQITSGQAHEALKGKSTLISTQARLNVCRTGVEAFLNSIIE